MDSSDQRERTNAYRAAARFVCGTATYGIISSASLIGPR